MVVVVFVLADPENCLFMPRKGLGQRLGNMPMGKMPCKGLGNITTATAADAQRPTAHTMPTTQHRVLDCGGGSDCDDGSSSVDDGRRGVSRLGEPSKDWFDKVLGHINSLWEDLDGERASPSQDIARTANGHPGV
mmetsp:Transcript_30283/g.64451  ORF Transcript_30283/g.64451 Transcript_30283/m.64451 type:complete len:135 (+) Transcript_30283:873-1277(+)